VLVDFSSPNIAKEMHVGHLRSTIIGDTICRVLEFCGHDVMRINHVGDWGTQFGMLISYLQDEYPDILTNPPNISDLTVIYKAAKKRFDEDAAFKERSRLNVVRLQSGDEGCNTVWRLLCDISRKEFQVLYDALGVKLTEVGESFYNPMIPGVIEELEKVSLGIMNHSTSFTYGI
jgi:arginyl-tRNA synthetase